MKVKRIFTSAEDFEDYADELLQCWMGDFTERGLTREVNEDDWLFDEHQVMFVYTQRAMRLYDNACRRLQTVGEKMFPEDSIEVKNSEIIWP